MSDKLNIVVVGAHPDDCEIAAGGITARYVEQGHNVTYIVMTNGDSGHHSMSKDDLKSRRYRESLKVADVLGIHYEIMGYPDGFLVPDLEARMKLICRLRECNPDVIITHCHDDYHPDHRATYRLVCDTAYMLNVPLIAPETPPLQKKTVYCHISMSPEDSMSANRVIIPIDNCIEQKVQALHQNESQVYEWLPWIDCIDPATIPADESGRLGFLRSQWLTKWKNESHEYISCMKGLEADVCFVEALIVSSLGKQLNQEDYRKYFPFGDSVFIAK